MKETLLNSGQQPVMGAIGMISICLPSRKRLWSLQRLIHSIEDHTENLNNVEMIVYDDNDPGDDLYQKQEWPKFVKFYRTPERLNISTYWDMASQKGSGPIYMLCGDDVVFRTLGWDRLVEEAFAQYPDGIVLVYGDDGDPNTEKTQSPHPFLHQKWIDAVGYFTPHHFSGDFSDTWVSDMADAVNRKHKIDAFFEHMHYAFRKGELDQVQGEKLVMHFRDNMPQRYIDTLPEREAGIENLKKAISQGRQE